MKKFFNLNTLVITILLQLLLVLLFNTSIVLAISLERLRSCTNFFNTLIIILNFFVIFSIGKVSEYKYNDIENNLLKNNLKDSENMIKLLRSQRHSYINHIQSIKSMLYIGEYESLENYLEGISEEYRTTSNLVRVGSPALTSLLSIKKEIAEKKGVKFDIKCTRASNFDWINSWELCDMVGNLIDNAIEASIMSLVDKKYVLIKIDTSDESILIYIENTGVLDKNIKTEDLFKLGVSTKNSIGRGYGLHIAKQIAEKYSGNIEIKQTSDEFVSTRLILQKGDFRNAKKTV